MAGRDDATPDDTGDPIATAQRLGIEADAEATRQWMLAVDASEHGIGVDAETGTFGDQVAMLDFDPADLDRFRRLVPFVRLAPSPEIESAIAISGSAAQGKVQLFPGDTDFYERAHIRAGTREEAEAILRAAMRATAMRAFDEPDVVLVQANLGEYDQVVTERGQQRDPGDAITWTPADVAAGEIVVGLPDGGTRTIRWDDCPIGGWNYFHWIVADRGEGRIWFASNMVDPSWENASGEMESLDGAIDPTAQEIYLEPSALALVQRVSGAVAPDAREAYRLAMRGEARHYTHEDPNFAKAAKRLYNLFRVADELEAAAYVRELFDEPSACLYQVPGLLEAADVALEPDSGITRETVLSQLEIVADAIEHGTDGEAERDLLAQLGRLRESALREGEAGESWDVVLAEVRASSASMVNEFFRERLLGYDRVRELVEELARP
jgi:hypothetical protein